MMNTYKTPIGRASRSYETGPIDCPPNGSQEGSAEVTVM